MKFNQFFFYLKINFTDQIENLKMSKKQILKY